MSRRRVSLGSAIDDPRLHTFADNRGRDACFMCGRPERDHRLAHDRASGGVRDVLTGELSAPRANPIRGAS